LNVVVSVAAWANFIFERLLKEAVFPAVAVLLFFAVFNRRDYKNKQPLYFILLASAITLVVRYVVFVQANTQINTRYLYLLGFYAMILCAPGVPKIVQFLKYLTKRFFKVKEIYLTILVLVVVGIACIGKALHPPDVKQYIQEPIKIIKQADCLKPPLLISNSQEARRVAWHSKAELMPLTDVVDINNPVFFADALVALYSKNKNIFLLLELESGGLKKHFSDKNIIFPKKLILIKKLKVKHGNISYIYRYSP
jgi:hypothetical protein